MSTEPSPPLTDGLAGPGDAGYDDEGASAVDVTRFDGERSAVVDSITVEEPVEIRLSIPGELSELSLSVTMRTPGSDEELAAGFLFTEGIVDEPSQIEEVERCAPNAEGKRNVVRVRLAEGTRVDRESLTRHVYTSSSCGVCGKTSIEAVRVRQAYPIRECSARIAARVIHQLPETLQSHQSGFRRTGGIHAAALFDLGGALLDVREDVGRHNAVDKLIGATFLRGGLPLDDRILMLSGRAGFELVQKAARAGVPVVGAVSAPSSLAVELARETGMTLLAFVRETRFNCYSRPDRIAEN
jgi:FdhD protein